VEEALGHHPGGIASLDILIEAHPLAIESDLIDRGLRLRQLGTNKLTWRDLHAIVAYLDERSALGRAIQGDAAPWQLPEMLLAAAVDRLTWLAWAKTKDGQKGRNVPKPIPRPGVEGPERIGNQPVSLDDINEFLGWGV
jgi:hypothetical protein